MKAIIGIHEPGHLRAGLLAAARRLDAGAAMPGADYQLRFATAAELFASFTPQVMRTLEVLQGRGPQTVNALARTLARNYSNVHADVRRLMADGLVKRQADGRVCVPFEAVEIRVSMSPLAETPVSAPLLRCRKIVHKRANVAKRRPLAVAVKG